MPPGGTHQCLDDGMVGGIHVGVQREGTLPLTVVGCIAFRCDDPVLPREGSEARPQSDHAEAPSRVPPCVSYPCVDTGSGYALLTCVCEEGACRGKEVSLVFCDPSRRKRKKTQDLERTLLCCISWTRGDIAVGSEPWVKDHTLSLLGVACLSLLPGVFMLQPRSCILGKDSYSQNPRQHHKLC